MSFDELKKLKSRILENSEELKKLYPISADVFISLDNLLKSYPCDTRIELWLNYMQEIINEVIDCLEIIENQDDIK